MVKKPDTIQVSYSIQELIELVKEQLGHESYRGEVLAWDRDGQEVQLSTVYVTLYKTEDY